MCAIVEHVPVVTEATKEASTESVGAADSEDGDAGEPEPEGEADAGKKKTIRNS